MRVNKRRGTWREKREKTFCQNVRIIFKKNIFSKEDSKTLENVSRTW